MATSADLVTFKNEPLELDRQFQLSVLHPVDGRGGPSQSGQLAMLKQQLEDRLATLDGSAWQLLLLEWRYDFALLFDHARLWMAHVDAKFNTEPVLKK